VRVSDLDRDHSQIFVDSSDLDSEFLFARMQEAVFEVLGVAPMDRVLDVAAGIGRDARALAERGIRVTNAEPSKLLTELEALVAERESWKDLGASVTRVRTWGEALPFRDASFGASFCKGSLDHFDDPVRCIAEMARVTRPDGRVVLAVANMNALALRWMRRLESRGSASRCRRPGRRHWDAPADHMTRYDPALLRSQAERHLHIEVWMGVSMLWGTRAWQRILRALPPTTARSCLRTADALARRVPDWADLLLVAGRPKA